LTRNDPQFAYFDHLFHVRFAFQFQDVRAVMQKNPKGLKVLEEYDKHKTLSSESRQTLVKIAVAELVHDCGP